jgi:formamidopyrimidine-DNA glycosylase
MDTMPELPEIFNLATQIDRELRGKMIHDVEVRQEKCLNAPVKQFTSLLTGKAIGAVASRGKWVFIKLDPAAYFLLSLGMGGNVLYHAAGEDLPEKYRLALTFDDASRLSIGFWWFGYAHAVEDLRDHEMTRKLGISPLDPALTLDKFKDMLKSRRVSIKTALLDQSFLAGIGNVYVQDILFKAGLRPDRRISSLSDDEKKALYEAMRGNLEDAVALGGIAPEKDLYGKPGRIPMSWFQVGYREGEPCPVCGTMIEKIKAGSTASYICPKCQR